jgi:hypothetical protein
VGRNRREARGFLAKPPLLPPLTVQNRGGGSGRRPALEGGGAGGPGLGGGRGMGQREEGDEGISSPCSP